MVEEPATLDRPVIDDIAQDVPHDFLVYETRA